MGYGCVRVFRRVRFVVVVVGSAADGNGCLCGLLRMGMVIVMTQRVTCGLTAGARERWRCSLRTEYAEIILTLKGGRKCCGVGEMHDVRRTADSGQRTDPDYAVAGVGRGHLGRIRSFYTTFSFGELATNITFGYAYSYRQKKITG